MYVHSVALILNFASVASGELELTINSIFFPLLPIYFVSAENTVVQKSWFGVDWPRKKNVQSEIAALRIREDGSNQRLGTSQNIT